MKSSHDSETPAHGQQVITACAFIYKISKKQIKVFLPKRSSNKKFLPSVYELPGGHIDFGENIIDGLKREIMEEFEMRVSVGEPYFVFTYLNKIKGAHAIEVVYLAQFIDSIKNIKIHPEDHSSYGWFTLEDVREIVSKHMNTEDDFELQAIYKGFQKVDEVTINHE